ncbi:hypothetical protein CRM22_005731 [Opisthorchis felineus]|uniref:DUF3668 domain-containing protein n=1 Tax=Opisthorchis felineus TaxID=147828 RepID=A0A4S2LPQ9_OPIFE|nr:hypothetical protein CRM22_005731 [Opisthorchis felineus]TGZ65724.1 hypothetical protein CRM22_005731 [Opisthorchis felineus]
MLPQPRWLVVAALISGRNFPERPDYHLVCEARFNNEVLSTDPMPHTVQPLFEQELAWELDRSRLKQHRLHRTVLKIQLYAVHTSTPVKEAVGMFMLDLRSCSFSKEYKWFRLLHCKYKGPPEVFCGIYLDTNEGDVVRNQVVKSGFGASLSAADLTPRVLSLREDVERTANSDPTSQRVWHVIGPKALSKKPFLLTLKFGEVSNNLASLIPITKDLSTESHSGFYFSCDILGTSVAASRFDSPVQTNLSPEEHQFFIRSTVGVLRAYFQQISPIPVKLYYGTRCLARALVASDRLLASADSTLQNAVILEGYFQLLPAEPSGKNASSMILTDEDDKPCVSFSLQLRELQDRTPTQIQTSSQPQPICDSVKPNERADHVPGILRQRNWSPARSKSDERTQGIAAHVSLLDAQHKELTKPDKGDDSGVNQSEVGLGNSSPKQFIRRFCYTIELRSLKYFHSSDEETKVYARYVYPPFESGAPVMTMPPVALPRNEEVILPNGFCAFEFAASLPELRERITATPLVVEVFVRSEEPQGSDSLLGRSMIQLGAIFNCPIHKAPNSKSTTQRYAGVAELVSIRSVSENDLSGSGVQSDRIVGQLVYSLLLEDHGPHLMMKDTETEHKQAIISESEMGENKLHKLEDVRSTAEYRTAFELELWRANEEAKFTARLKQREQLLMATLAEEWHKRDNEREAICRKKLSEYQTLEDKLRSTLAELATRECQLAAGETELARIRQETAQQAELKRKETAQQARAEIRELEIQLKMEKTESQRWREQAEELRARYTDLENELNSVRNRLVQAQSHKSSESIDRNRSEQQPASYQLELAKLATELAKSRETIMEARRQLEDAQRGRDRYKHLWTRALHEVARVKQEADFNARQSLARREAELEQLRMRYLNMEEKEIMAKAAGMPESQPAASKTHECVQVYGSTRDRTDSHQNVPDSSGIEQKQSAADSELERLMEERDSLLGTGVYEPDDPIIINLEKRIQDLLSQQ